MGVVNVTPDSFSDGGRYLDHDAAIAHGLELVAEGADIVDVGGESTRPGAEPVAEAEELRRVVPVVEELWIDPGIGFGKTADHSWRLLRHLDALVATGYPVAVGTSRKRFLGAVLGRSDGLPEGELVPTDDRLEGSVATAVWAIMQGA